MTTERAPQASAVPEVFYELADELAECQHELRRITGGTHRHHHRPHGPHGFAPAPPQGPHGFGEWPPHPGAPVPPDAPVPPPPGALVPPHLGAPVPPPVPDAPVPPPPPHPGAPVPPPPGAPVPPPPGPVPPAPGAPAPVPGEPPAYAERGVAPYPGAPEPWMMAGPQGSGPHPQGPHHPAPFGRMEQGTMAALRYLAKNGGEASPGTIAGDLGLSNARISNILAALEKRHWVTREHDEADRRKVVVQLTSAGAAYIDGLSRSVRDDLASFLAELGEDDSKELIALLGRVIKVAQERRDRAIDREVQDLVSAGKDAALAPGDEPPAPGPALEPGCGPKLASGGEPPVPEPPAPEPPAPAPEDEPTS